MVDIHIMPTFLVILLQAVSSSEEDQGGGGFRHTSSLQDFLANSSAISFSKLISSAEDYLDGQINPFIPVSRVSHVLCQFAAIVQRARNVKRIELDDDTSFAKNGDVQDGYITTSREYLDMRISTHTYVGGSENGTTASCLAYLAPGVLYTSLRSIPPLLEGLYSYDGAIAIFRNKRRLTRIVESCCMIGEESDKGYFQTDWDDKDLLVAHDGLCYQNSSNSPRYISLQKFIHLCHQSLLIPSIVSVEFILRAVRYVLDDAVRMEQHVRRGEAHIYAHTHRSTNETTSLLGGENITNLTENEFLEVLFVISQLLLRETSETMNVMISKRNFIVNTRNKKDGKVGGIENDNMEDSWKWVTDSDGIDHVRKLRIAQQSKGETDLSEDLRCKLTVSSKIDRFYCLLQLCDPLHVGVGYLEKLAVEYDASKSRGVGSPNKLAGSNPNALSSPAKPLSSSTVSISESATLQLKYVLRMLCLVLKLDAEIQPNIDSSALDEAIKLQCILVISMLHYPLINSISFTPWEIMGMIRVPSYSHSNTSQQSNTGMENDPAMAVDLHMHNVLLDLRYISARMNIILEELVSFLYYMYIGHSHSRQNVSDESVDFSADADDQNILQRVQSVIHSNYFTILIAILTKNEILNQLQESHEYFIFEYFCCYRYQFLSSKRNTPAGDRDQNINDMSQSKYKNNPFLEHLVTPMPTHVIFTQKKWDIVITMKALKLWCQLSSSSDAFSHEKAESIGKEINHILQSEDDNCFTYSMFLLFALVFACSPPNYISFSTNYLQTINFAEIISIMFRKYFNHLHQLSVMASVEIPPLSLLLTGHLSSSTSLSIEQEYGNSTISSNVIQMHQQCANTLLVKSLNYFNDMFLQSNKKSGSSSLSMTITKHTSILLASSDSQSKKTVLPPAPPHKLWDVARFLYFCKIFGIIDGVNSLVSLWNSFRVVLNETLDPIKILNWDEDVVPPLPVQIDIQKISRLLSSVPLKYNGDGNGGGGGGGLPTIGSERSSLEMKIVACYGSYTLYHMIHAYVVPFLYGVMDDKVIAKSKAANVISQAALSLSSVETSVESDYQVENDTNVSSGGATLEDILRYGGDRLLKSVDQYFPWIYQCYQQLVDIRNGKTNQLKEPHLLVVCRYLSSTNLIKLGTVSVQMKKALSSRIRSPRTLETQRTDEKYISESPWKPPRLTTSDHDITVSMAEFEEVLIWCAYSIWVKNSFTAINKLRDETSTVSPQEENKVIEGIYMQKCQAALAETTKKTKANSRSSEVKSWGVDFISPFIFILQNFGKFPTATSAGASSGVVSMNPSRPKLQEPLEPSVMIKNKSDMAFKGVEATSSSANTAISNFHTSNINPHRDTTSDQYPLILDVVSSRKASDIEFKELDITKYSNSNGKAIVPTKWSSDNTVVNRSKEILNTIMTMRRDGNDSIPNMNMKKSVSLSNIDSPSSSDISRKTFTSLNTSPKHDREGYVDRTLLVKVQNTSSSKDRIEVVSPFQQEVGKLSFSPHALPSLTRPASSSSSSSTLPLSPQTALQSKSSTNMKDDDVYEKETINGSYVVPQGNSNWNKDITSFYEEDELSESNTIVYNSPIKNSNIDLDENYNNNVLSSSPEQELNDTTWQEEEVLSSSFVGEKNELFEETKEVLWPVFATYCSCGDSSDPGKLSGPNLFALLSKLDLLSDTTILSDIGLLLHQVSAHSMSLQSHFVRSSISNVTSYNINASTTYSDLNIVDESSAITTPLLSYEEFLVFLCVFAQLKYENKVKLPVWKLSKKARSNIKSSTRGVGDREKMEELHQESNKDHEEESEKEVSDEGNIDESIDQEGNWFNMWQRVMAKSKSFLRLLEECVLPPLQKRLLLASPEDARERDMYSLLFSLETLFSIESIEKSMTALFQADRNYLKRSRSNWYNTGVGEGAGGDISSPNQSYYDSCNVMDPIVESMIAIHIIPDIISANEVLQLVLDIIPGSNNIRACTASNSSDTIVMNKRYFEKRCEMKLPQWQWVVCVVAYKAVIASITKGDKNIGDEFYVDHSVKVCKYAVCD